MGAASVPNHMKRTGLYVCNIKHKLGCKYSSQTTFDANNFNPHEKPTPLLNMGSCSQSMQRIWWPVVSTNIVTGSHRRIQRGRTPLNYFKSIFSLQYCIGVLKIYNIVIQIVTIHQTGSSVSVHPPTKECWHQFCRVLPYLILSCGLYLAKSHAANDDVYEAKKRQRQDGAVGHELR